MRSVKFLVLVLVLALVPVAAAWADTGYVLVAPNWGAKQTAAVQMAGGIVLYAHDRAGIGAVSSNAPDFLSRALASNAFQYGAQDQVVQWQLPEPVEETVTPGDDRFFPIQWNMQAMEAPAAWAAGCTGQGVRVAVIDGGIYSAHQDLAGAIDTACSKSFVTGITDPFTDTGTFWHGTHVAGIVAARDNTVGTIGVAPDATIIGVKALQSGGGTFAAVISSILYASDPAAFGAGGCARADIINMSLGAVFPKSATGAGPLIGALNHAVNFAASQGVLVVSSAGNNGIDFGQAGNLATVPADSGSGLAVTATGPVGFALGATNFRRLASYSNYGEGLTYVAAPGGDFVLPGSAICTMATNGAPTTNFCWVFDLVLAPCRGSGASTNSYCFAAGTSMASPAAAGVAALIKGRFPGISLGALKAKLAQTADDEGKVGHDQVYGNGFVNARRACTE
jgi:lantibiotic leader peptide-processing serine protease